MASVHLRASANRGTSGCRSAAGLTLIEMLVALTASLIMMAAVVTLFGVVSASVNESRAALELSDRMRFAEQRIRLDLQGVTAPTLPVQKPDAGQGYFEILAGPRGMRDYNGTGTGLAPFWTDKNGTPSVTQPYANSTIYGDLDDVICFTTRSTTTPFMGKKSGGGSLQSPIAEVIYYLRPSEPISSLPPSNVTALRQPQTYSLYRRQLLVLPGNTTLVQGDLNPQTGSVSARFDGTNWIVNSLSDLSHRGARFNHNHTTAPYNWNTSGVTGFLTSTWRTEAEPAFTGAANVDLTADRKYEEVLITGVLSFDIRGWDGTAPLRNNSNQVMTPGDPGWNAGAANGATGAFVDMGYDDSLNPASQFSHIPNTGAGVTLTKWDTWPATLLTDQGSATQLDFETPVTPPASSAPPYNVPLRGIQITLRCYDPDSRQIQQRTIVHSFVPE